MERTLHHLFIIHFERLRFFQRSRNGASNAMCRRRHMLRPHKIEPCITYSQHNPSLPSSPSDSMFIFCFMFCLWVVAVRGVAIASPAVVQAETRKSSHGPVDKFRPARWCRMPSINSPEKGWVLGIMTSMTSKRNGHGMAGWQDTSMHQHDWTTGKQKW